MPATYDVGFLILRCSMERFDFGINTEDMTEEEMREAARQYAHELVDIGGTSESDPGQLMKVVLQESERASSKAYESDYLSDGASPYDEYLNLQPRESSSRTGASMSQTDQSAVKAEPAVRRSEIRILQPEASAPQAGTSIQRTESSASYTSASAPRATSSVAQPEKTAPASTETKKGKFRRGKSRADKANAKAQSQVQADNDPVAEASAELAKLKKKDLLEIMLRQGEEIDALRARVADLEARLADREFTISKAGSIAEASLALTGIFEEAQKAAELYIFNLERAAARAAGNRGDSDER